MVDRRKIETIEEFDAIRLRLSRFFEKLAHGLVDTQLAVEPEGSKWWPWHYEDPRSGGPLTDFGFPYVAEILQRPVDSGWQLSPPNKDRGERDFCWIHKHEYTYGKESLYIKIAIIEYPFANDPSSEFLVLLWSCHGNKDDVF